MDDDVLESTDCNIFEEIQAPVPVKDNEACDLKFQTVRRKSLLSFPDENIVTNVKTKNELKDADCGDRIWIYINESLCHYNKFLCFNNKVGGLTSTYFRFGYEIGQWW